MLAYFVAKKGEKNGIFILSMHVCLCLHLFCSYLDVCCTAPIFVCLYFLLLHLFCNYFRLCVDVGTNAATS